VDGMPTRMGFHFLVVFLLNQEDHDRNRRPALLKLSLSIQGLRYPLGGSACVLTGYFQLDSLCLKLNLFEFLKTIVFVDWKDISSAKLSIQLPVKSETIL